MAALHIIPLNGAQIPPKVLALIRERAFKMEVGQIATHGFASDGCDVYMRMMGGAIQAIVQGGSMPYMLTIKIEGKQYQYAVYYNNTGGSADFIARAHLKVASPTQTEWIEAGAESFYPAAGEGVITPSGFAPYAADVDGYAYIATQFPETATGDIVGDNLQSIFYTAIGNPVESTIYYKEIIGGANAGEGIPADANYYSNLQSGDWSSVTMIRFGELSMLEGLPPEQRVIRVEICCAPVFQESGLSVPGSVSRDYKITAEYFTPPTTDPKSFYPHDYRGPDFDISEDRAPKVDSAKTLTLTVVAPAVNKSEPYQADAIFAYDLSTGKMTLEPA